MLVAFHLPTQPTRSTRGITWLRHGPNQIAARNRSRPVTTKRTTPNTPTNAISILSVVWELLTGGQRIAWGNYAYATPLTDAWGTIRYIRGYAHFMRSNRPRLLANLPIIHDAPTTPGFPDYTNPTITIAPDQRHITVSPNNGDEWANADLNWMLVWLSRPRPHTRNRPAETYHYVAAIEGSTLAFPTPLTLELPTPITQTTDYTLRTAVTRDDGRYTSQ